MRFSSRQIPPELSEQKTTPVSLQNTHNSELFPRVTKEGISLFLSSKYLCRTPTTWKPWGSVW